jgi:beta-mannosidase
MAADRTDPPGLADLLDGASWTCASTPPGAATSPEDLGAAGPSWIPAEVPGTAAGAVVRFGAPVPVPDALDGADWWFRCRFEAPADTGPDGWILELDGVATLSDVWLDGGHLGRTESMFAAVRRPVALAPGAHELVIRCAALDPVLEVRRPRPRWKSSIPRHPNLRWVRTTLLGRQVGWSPTPPPVGPWRPVRLVPAGARPVLARRIRTSCEDGAPGASPATVHVHLEVPGPIDGAVLDVEGRRAPLACTEDGGRWTLAGEVVVEAAERWWPNGYGPQRRYPVRVQLADETVDLGLVGFRTVVADRSDDGFTLVVNDVPIFCRGACWFPLDPVAMAWDDRRQAAALDEVAAAGWTMVRIPGGTAYGDERFFEQCDRLGVLVWQDLMLAQAPPPEGDEDAVAVLVGEAVDVAAWAGAHPSLAVLCGGQQLEEQPAMQGLPAARWRSALLDEVLPDALAEVAPGIPWVTSSPSGGDLPFRSDAGVSHYAGVGPYLRPLTDLRLAAPRFVSEGIALAVPPEPASVDEAFGGAAAALADPAWRLGAHRDAGSPIDLVDVTDHYIGELFGQDAAALQVADPERYLDLARAVGVEVVEQAVAEWRRPGSACAGVLLMAHQDLRPGPGWGVVDAAGRSKATWWALARQAAPVAVLCTDEGVNGLAVHVVNDTDQDVVGVLDVGLHGAGHRSEAAAAPVTVPAHGAVVLRADGLIDGFRDLTYAYRFGPRALELVTIALVGPDGRTLADAAFAPGGPVRPVDPELRLQVEVEPADGGAWLLTVSANRFAQRVQVRTPGFAPSDSWFHLAPGSQRAVRLVPGSGQAGPPSGEVGALNAPAATPVRP